MSILSWLAKQCLFLTRKLSISLWASDFLRLKLLLKYSSELILRFLETFWCNPSSLVLLRSNRTRLLVTFRESCESGLVTWLGFSYLFFSSVRKTFAGRKPKGTFGQWWPSMLFLVVPGSASSSGRHHVWGSLSATGTTQTLLWELFLSPELWVCRTLDYDKDAFCRLLVFSVKITRSQI